MTKLGASEKDLAMALVSIRTEKEVEQVIQLAEELYGKTRWRHVGDRPNNIGTVRLGSDPALGVVERLINAQDSMLDLGRMLNPTDEVRSPTEAAQKWLGVPKGGIADMTESERRELGSKIRIWLNESGDSKRPTVVWEDDGIGQSPGSFPTTFMSLNENNKVSQRWNMGTYGQGGAVTFGFSKATVVYSRRHPDYRGSNPDRVGWTIVKEVETDPEKEMLPTYMYLVGSDNEVMELAPELFPDLRHGSRITGVAYDLQGWTGPFTTGLWQFLHAAIFEPVLPFLLTGKREKEKDYGSRIIVGNTVRLDRPDRARGDIDVAHMDSTKLDLGPDLGKVVFRYWVLRRPEGSTSTSDAAAAYVRADSAVSITLFGQRQDVMPRSWIKTQAFLPFLYKNMVVQINANNLTARAKRELFASTRERATKSELREHIYERLAAVLRNDEELKRLNHEERERLLRQSTAASSEKVRKRLAKFITTKVKNLLKAGEGSADSGTGGTRKGKSGGTSPPRNTDDSRLHNVPTRLEIKRKSMRLRQGGTCWTWVEIDAKNGYLPGHDDSLTVEIDRGDEKVRLAMRSTLLGGLTRWTFEASPDAPIGEVKVSVSLMTPAGILEDSTVLHVEKPEEARRKSTGPEPETGPDVRWVTKEEWDDHEMSARMVGYVSVDEDETIIWVNRNYHLLDRALGRRNLTPEQVETRADRYQFPVAVALWLQDDAAKKADPAPSADYRNAEMERLAEAVLLASDPDVDLALEESED